MNPIEDVFLREVQRIVIEIIIMMITIMTSSFFLGQGDGEASDFHCRSD